VEQIIAPISKEIILSELTKEKFVRITNYGNNHIYIIDSNDSPNVMQEIGRLREEAFREAGGGTGAKTDIDNYDLGENPYKQLIVWDPEGHDILGGYRFFDCKDAKFNENGDVDLATAKLFKISEEFIEKYLPYTLELGRSFVQPRYQASKIDRKALYTLDNLWDGLGAVTEICPHLKYFFGKVTMYTHFNLEARNLILTFLKKYFNDGKDLLKPLKNLEIIIDETKYKDIFSKENFREDYKILNFKVRELGETIPPLLNSYMNLSPTFKVFGTAINHHFGIVEETGIMVTIDDIYESKKHRHLTINK